ncbi:MAG: SGNH/GDSL hydrolase family protein, partial [Acidimicrobiales bacterium]
MFLAGQPVGAAVPSFSAPPAPQRRAYVQGDSVMVGALADVTSALRADGWAGTVTGFIGLHTYAAIPLFRQVRSTMGSVAVIELGANDCCDGASFGRVIDQVMQVLSGLHVIWLTIPVWKPGVASMNQAIWAASRRWPNLTVADWAATLAAHPGYEYPDQVHLKPEGS